MLEMELDFFAIIIVYFCIYEDNYYIIFTLGKPSLHMMGQAR